MKKIITFPTLIGIFFLLGGIITGIILIQNTKTFRLGATAELTPKDVRVSNITNTSFTVSWITDIPSTGFVKAGTSQAALSLIEKSEITEPSTTHFATLKVLKPTTDYFFKINSGGEDYDSNGIPWTIQTAPDIGQPESSVIISGKVVDQNEIPVPNALVSAQLSGSTSVSTFTSSEGNWLLTLSLARATSLSSYAAIDTRDSVVEIFAQAASLGISTAKIHPADAKPAPPMVLGQVHDFTNITTSGDTNAPSATLNLPSESTSTPAPGESKLDTQEASSSSELATVTLDSHDEGEVVTTTTPEFFGEGPAGSTITIKVESDPITDEVIVNPNGDWEWSPPSNLEPGNHKITLSWRDVQGILHTLTRSFTVSAAEGPSFESSPSQTLSPTSQPSPTASAGAATPTPSGTATPLPAPIPESGTLTPTLVLLIMGIGVLVLSTALVIL